MKKNSIQKMLMSIEDLTLFESLKNDEMVKEVLHMITYNSKEYGTPMMIEMRLDKWNNDSNHSVSLRCEWENKLGENVVWISKDNEENEIVFKAWSTIESGEIIDGEVYELTEETLYDLLYHVNPEENPRLIETVSEFKV